MVVPNTACTVATDRVFAEDHTWIKTVATNIVVLGLTPTMMEILDHPKDLALPNGDEVMAKGDVYGSIVGYKMSADLVMPVSGKVIQVDKVLASFSGQDVIAPIMNDPYGGGWLIVVQLTKPDELKALLTPQQYLDLLKKK
jgi:glycine cleavage system H protein